MDNLAQLMQAPDPATLSVSIRASIPAIALRYFDLKAKFVAQAQASLGCKLPGTLRASRNVLSGTPASFVLAWRSPTETLLLAETDAILDRCAEMPSSEDGCVVDLTGSYTLFSCQGSQIAQLFARLGGPNNLPAPGEARPGRLAELPALALRLQNGDCQILVERHYSAHLGAWIRHAIDCMV